QVGQFGGAINAPLVISDGSRTGQRDKQGRNRAAANERPALRQCCSTRHTPPRVILGRFAPTGLTSAWPGWNGRSPRLYSDIVSVASRTPGKSQEDAGTAARPGRIRFSVCGSQRPSSVDLVTGKYDSLTGNSSPSPLVGERWGGDERLLA